MKRFQFSQQRLLGLKKQQLQYAKLNMARATQTLLNSRAELQEAEARLADHLQRLRERTLRGIGVAAMVVQRQATPALTRQIELAEQQVLRAANELHTVRQTLQQSQRESDSLQELQTIHWEAHLAEHRQQEQRVMDDNAMRKWLAEQR